MYYAMLPTRALFAFKTARDRAMFLQDFDAHPCEEHEVIAVHPVQRVCDYHNWHVVEGHPRILEFYIYE